LKGVHMTLSRNISGGKKITTMASSCGYSCNQRYSKTL
jgi:hypothetical protein